MSWNHNHHGRLLHNKTRCPPSTHLNMAFESLSTASGTKYQHQHHLQQHSTTQHKPVVLALWRIHQPQLRVWVRHLSESRAFRNTHPPLTKISVSPLSHHKHTNRAQALPGKPELVSFAAHPSPRRSAKRGGASHGGCRFNMRALDADKIRCES